MRVILAPAKKMRVDVDSFSTVGLPRFLPEAERLKTVLRSMGVQELQRLWKCNDAIAKLNVERLADMDLRRNLTPAVLSYEGIAYQYMAPRVMEEGQLAYLQEHLRILSGFYGLLRPFDGVTSYRLEMQARLAVDGCKDLYGFWGEKLARALAEETDTVVDLSSAEYSRAVKPHLPPEVRLLTCVFGEERGGKVVEKGTLCKMARGQMARWMAENQVSRGEDLREFCQLDYRYSPAHSTETEFVFLKGGC